MQFTFDKNDHAYHNIVDQIRSQFPSITGKIERFQETNQNQSQQQQQQQQQQQKQKQKDKFFSTTYCASDSNDDSDNDNNDFHNNNNNHYNSAETVFDSKNNSSPSFEKWIYLENAGGSQVPKQVAQAIYTYMLTSYVQAGAGYAISNRAASNIDRAHNFVSLIMNASETKGTIILGSSTTALIYMIADAFRDSLVETDEIIVSEAGHESNMTPWLALKKQHGIQLKIWPVNTTTLESCPLDSLTSLLTPFTKLVVFPHVSNLLGQVVDVAQIVKHVRARSPQAQVLVDGVAYAPHHVIDVQAWDVDWYVYSTYKVYGPHMGALYARKSILQQLGGINHFFIPKGVPYNFELGGSSHEGCAAINGLIPYLKFLARLACPTINPTNLTAREEAVGISRKEIVAAFELMTVLERPLVRKLFNGLEEMKSIGISILGPSLDLSTDEAVDKRVGTIAFSHETIPPQFITAKMFEKHIAIRSGHMYSFRLCKALGINISLGVTRVSLSHYNTLEEIDLFLTTLREFVMSFTNKK